MKRARLFLLIMSFGFTMLSQQHLADSVQKILMQTIPDTTRAYNMVMLAMYTEPQDINKAHELYKEAVDFSISKKLHFYAGYALYFEATPYGLSGNYSKEIENLIRAVELFEKSDHPKARTELASAYGGIARYYRSIEKFDSAVIASLKGIAILEEVKNYKKLTTQCLNLAMIYQQLKLHDKQKEYVDKGLVYAKESKDNSALMLAYLQQGHYFTEIRNFIKAKSYADSASVYFSDSFDFSRKQNYYLLKANTFQNINEYDSAVFYYQKCYENAKQIGSRWNMTEPLMQIGYIYLQQNKFTDAEHFVRMGLEIAETDSIRTFMKEGYGTLSDIYSAAGRYKEAFEFLGKYNEIKDELLSEERKKFTLDLDKKYESEKKDAQLKIQQTELAKRRGINYAISVLAFLLIIILLLVYRILKHKQKLQQHRINELETEKQLSATEAVLKGEEQERTRLAKDLHDGLGGMLSGIKFSMNTMKGNLILTPDNAQAFERSMDMLDSSIKEMRRVAHNLMPEALVKFGLDTALSDFCNDINQSGALKVSYQSIGMEEAGLDQTTSITIFRIVQELIHNTLKHAVAKHAIVQLSKSASQISITVEDDGKGFDPEILKKTNGIGWSNILHRVEFMKGVLNVQSEPGKGTSVHIELNI
jgi:two-component system, NarL family, sensor kinase